MCELTNFVPPLGSCYRIMIVIRSTRNLDRVQKDFCENVPRLHTCISTVPCYLSCMWNQELVPSLHLCYEFMIPKFCVVLSECMSRLPSQCTYISACRTYFDRWLRCAFFNFEFLYWHVSVPKFATPSFNPTFIFYSMHLFLCICVVVRCDQKPYFFGFLVLKQDEYFIYIVSCRKLKDCFYFSRFPNMYVKSCNFKNGCVHSDAPMFGQCLVCITQKLKSLSVQCIIKPEMIDISFGHSSQKQQWQKHSPFFWRKRIFKIVTVAYFLLYHQGKMPKKVFFIRLIFLSLCNVMLKNHCLTRNQNLDLKFYLSNGKKTLSTYIAYIFILRKVVS